MRACVRGRLFVRNTSNTPSIPRTNTAIPDWDILGASHILVRSVVTEDDGSELTLVPAAFAAVTVNVYAVIWVRPIIVTDVPFVVAVTPPGSDVTVYPVIGLPPSEAGAVHETTARTSDGIADTLVGAPGTRAGVTGVDGSEDRLDPMALVAVTVKV